MRERARKIPRLKALTAFLPAYGVLVANLHGQTVDTARLLRQAIRAESEYEAAVRRFAPLSFDLPTQRSCDEVVGRFCIYYEGGSDSLPAEPEAVRAARARSIDALAAAGHLKAGDERIAFPLVRLLLRAGRLADAVSAARAFASSNGDPVKTNLLLGYALHGASDTEAALTHFDAWIARLDAKDQDHVRSVAWLLDRKERARYQRMSGTERAAYAARLWRSADPLYLTAGNEVWSDHLARHALVYMLSRRPSIVSVESWGADLEQLTVRFGAPVMTTRTWRGGTMGSHEQFSEHWDQTARTYVPPVLRNALDTRARLDTVWPIDSLTSRSGHAPPPIRVMHVLEHQASVFAGRLAVSGVVRVDSLVKGGELGAALIVLDSALQVVSRMEGSARLFGDSVVFEAEAPLTPASWYYSAELFDRQSHFAARARYRIERPDAGSELALSSLMLAQPFAAGELPEQRTSSLLRPLTRPVIVASSRIGVYAEVRMGGEERRRTVQIQLETARLDRPGGLGRAMGWLGDKVGLGTPRSPSRVAWSVELEPGRPNALPVTVDLGKVEPGRYRLTLTVKDSETGESATSRRELLVVRATGSGRS